MVEGIKEKILSTIKSKEWYHFESLFKSNKKKRHLQDIEETLGELNRHLQTQLWNSLYLFSVEMYQNRSQLENEPDPMNIDDGLPLLKEQHHESFQVVLFFAQITLNLLKSKNAIATRGLIKFIAFLASVLGKLPNDSISQQSVNVCEEWVREEYPNFEAIQNNTLIVMVGLSLQSDAKKQAVKRVWALRKVLPSLVSNCNSVDDPITSLLVSCASVKVYLSCDEGVKFLSEILTFPQFVDPFHKTVKKSLASCSQNESAQYSKVYFRAWKTSSIDDKKVLEEKCLQDLMYLSVHISPKTVVSRNLASFLQYIHSHKKHVPTAAMIYKLYEPFIWRSLKAANGYVRMNAIRILCDAFPFTNGGTNEEEETLLEQQYKSILELLVDSSHLTRNAAITGSMHILSHYWILLPSHVIQQMFQIFITKHLCDVSNAEGRRAVIEGFIPLLDCVQAFSFMNNILPRIVDSFDDVSVTVRISFIKLLLGLKSRRHVKYWKIIPMKHLLHCLDEDYQCRPLIVKLIRNSYIPVDLDEKTWLQRTISFLTSNRSAARRFYQYISKDVDFEGMIRFILFIWRTVFRYVKLCLERNDSLLSNSNESIKENEPQWVNIQNARKKLTPIDKGTNKENMDESELQEGLPLDNAEVTAGLIDIIVIMWTVNTERFNKEENLKFIVVLRNRISKCFPIMWSFFKGTEIADSLLYLCSLLPSSFSPTMSGFCISQLKQISDDVNDETINLYLTAMCNWNRLDDILQLITDWLKMTFDSVDATSKSVLKKRKKVCFEETNPKPLVGLSFLTYLLKHRLNRLCLLHKNRHLVSELCQLMSRVKELIVKRTSVAEPISVVCSDEFILTCFRDYITLVIILEKAQPTSAEATELSNSQDNKEILTVFEDYIVLMERLLDDLWTEKSDCFGVSLLTSFVECSTSLFSAGGANVCFIGRVLPFIEIIFDKCIDSPELYTKVFTFMQQMESHLNAYYSNEQLENNSDLILTLLKRLLKENILTGMFSNSSNETSSAILVGTVAIYQKWNFSPRKLQIIIQLLTNYAVQEVRQQFEEKASIDKTKKQLSEEIYFVLLKEVISISKVATIFYNSLCDAIRSHSYGVPEVFASLCIITELSRSATNKSRNEFLTETKNFMLNIEDGANDDQSEFYRSSVKKCEEMLQILQ